VRERARNVRNRARADGLRNAAIAKRPFVSTKTVDHHASSILTKLGVPSRAEAVAMARKQPDKKP